jgi:2-keto-3-deoxy-6-phosphogluconate aldolase
LTAAGIGVLEVTPDGEGALDVIAGLADGPLLLGAGTVMTPPPAVSSSSTHVKRTFVLRPASDAPDSP